MAISSQTMLETPGDLASAQIMKTSRPPDA